MGQQRCGGVCVDTSRDAQNCGACGNACAAPNAAIGTCSAGKCVVMCDAQRTLCGNACVNVARNANHCGMCGNRCPGNQMCRQGQCGGNGMGNGNGNGNGNGGDSQTMGLNVVELEKLLAESGITLEQFTTALNVTPEELAQTHVALSDLRRLGLTDARLRQLGLTIEDLARIGVDVTG
jgi:hypothetical protein